MKIAYIAKFEKVWDEEPIAKAFEANGVEMVRLEEGNTAAYYIKKIEEAKPDLVLFTKLQIQDSWKFLGAMREKKIPTVSWTFDLLIGHPPREKVIGEYAFLNADYVFLTDDGHHKEYAERGIKTYTLRQGIPEEFCYMGEKDEKYEHDIVFIGTRNPTYPYRQSALEFLEETYGSRFKWYGKDNAFDIRGHELNKLYATAKIVIGCSMYSPNYWSNRIYETIGRGGFIISPDVEGLREEFTYYKHFVPYPLGKFSELKEKIDYFLKHDDLRDEIRTAGFNYVKENYLYKNRAKKFLEMYAKIKD